ncbi:hypothetical protein CBQ28_17460 [Pseudoalteromonas sp. GCY]|uniref:YbaN family protein n=1 Tax=Pseudoalteromonas sp. GCY TaxID=2003316 RepID=UPI000BFED159|nr:YbaN family protein [Pseudoalteromonas sp. GCY]PHI35873.1 hypothetical protein CBQ28_17460 [Pseudoalteromonas sp. GCY]QQQ68225.1 YbaN family protein [Pseudoalteromonas sp. GCY]
MMFKAALANYKKIALLLCGYLFVALGVIGIVLPVMPTTVFFILALACFSKASPKLALWLLNHPRFGASLTLWKQYKVIPQKAKVMATVGMAASYALLILLSPAAWLACVVGSVKIAVMSYIYSRPSKRI